MKKIVLYGDGLICPPHGFGESFADLLALRFPDLHFRSFPGGSEFLELEGALKNAAQHVIGKAPDLVFLALGHSDLVKGALPRKMAGASAELVKLLTAKTGAHIVFTSACLDLLPVEWTESAGEFNEALRILQSARCFFLDLNGPIGKFLEKHRLGPGEKRALHQNATYLTSMGRTLLAHAALDGLLGQGLLNG